MPPQRRSASAVGPETCHRVQLTAHSLSRERKRASIVSTPPGSDSVGSGHFFLTELQFFSRSFATRLRRKRTLGASDADSR